MVVLATWRYVSSKTASFKLRQDIRGNTETANLVKLDISELASERERETERKRQTDRQKQRDTDIQRERKREREREKQRDMQR